jgi:hypothetical protein
MTTRTLIRTGLATGLVAGLLAAPALAAPQDPVRFTVALEQARGHYDAGLIAYRGGDTATAAKHGKHPRNELYAAVKSELTPELRTAFEKSFAEIDALVAKRAPVAQLEAAVKAFGAGADRAVNTIPAAVLKSRTYRGGVMVELLESVEGEYQEGVKAGKVLNLAEYQDAIAFAGRANVLWAAYRPAFPADPKVDAALKALPGLITAKSAFEKVEAGIDAAKDPIAKAAGLEAKNLEPARLVANIQTLLGTARAAYARGDRAGADEALVEAYLEHFEDLEAPLMARDHDLMERLEHALRDDLRAMVKNGATAAAFNKALDAALVDLKRAASLLGATAER